MSTTTTAITTAVGVNALRSDPTRVQARSHPRVWRAGLVAGVAASIATMIVAALADAAGVPLEISGETIPLVGFANVTMIGAVIGTALAAVFARQARRPRTIFLRTTVALTVLSLVPDVIADADLATRFVLGLTHVVAAAIIVPVVARRLVR